LDEHVSETEHELVVAPSPIWPHVSIWQELWLQELIPLQMFLPQVLIS
jgi:hypothetical protein